MNDNNVNALDGVPGQQNKEIDGGQKKNWNKDTKRARWWGKCRGWFYGHFSIEKASKEIFIGDKTRTELIACAMQEIHAFFHSFCDVSIGGIYI